MSRWPERDRVRRDHEKPALKYFSGVGWACYAYGFAGARPYSIVGIGDTPQVAWNSAVRQVAKKWEEFIGFRSCDRK